MLPESLCADLDRYVELLKIRHGPDLVSVIVFGSHARGEVRPESDYGYGIRYTQVLIVSQGCEAMGR